MTNLQVNGTNYEVDEDGFLPDPELWNEEVAIHLAHSEGFSEVAAEHWKIIRYVRGYYLRNGTAPLLRKVCAETGFELSRLNQLFPSGAAKTVRKLAGLPNPAGAGCFAGACTLCGGCCAARQRA